MQEDMNELQKWDYNSREDHRKSYSDIRWCAMQPKGDPKYKIGDVVEFHVGGFGIINGVSKPSNGWPSSYSTEKIDELPDHASTKRAWHYEGDFKNWIAKSPLHGMG
jgi:hypothetical protein